MMATTPPITKAVPSTRTCKERPTLLSVPNNILLPPSFSKPYTPNLEYQITSKNLPPMPTPVPTPPANLPLQQFNDISDLKTLITSLFEEMGTMINLLTTVLTKLIMTTFLQLALWNTNGLHQHAEELKTFLSVRNIDIMLISKIHFTDKSYLLIPTMLSTIPIIQMGLLEAEAPSSLNTPSNIIHFPAIIMISSRLPVCLWKTLPVP
jgi:hypothetical protein